MSAVKTWLVSPGFVSVCKVIVCGSQAMRAVTWFGFFSPVHDPSFDLFTMSVQSASKTWLVNSGFESVFLVTDCGSRVKCVVFWIGFFFTAHVVSFNILHTVSVLSSMKTWLDSYGIESVRIATDRSPHVTRVVSMNGSVSVAHDVSYDSHFTGLELSAVHSLMDRPVSESVHKVTDCGSLVKRVNALSLALSEQVWQPGAPVWLCSVCIIPFQLPFMMSLIDSPFTAPVLSTLKSWVVRSVKDCKVTHDGPYVKRVMIRDVWPPCHDALASSLLRMVWQPVAHLLNWWVFSPCCDQGRVAKSRTQSSSLLSWASVCALSVQLPFMMSLQSSLHCVGVEHIENLVSQVCERASLQSI